MASPIELATRTLSRIAAAQDPSNLSAIYAASSPETRQAILALPIPGGIPSDIVTATLLEGNSRLLLPLASRPDLSKDDLRSIISAGNIVVNRVIADRLQLPENLAALLLPGDETIRHRLFRRVSFSSQFRRSILNLRGFDARPAPVSSSMLPELARPEYALWAASSINPDIREAARSSLGELPRSLQLRLWGALTESGHPMDEVRTWPGWRPQVLDAVRRGVAVDTSVSQVEAARFCPGPGDEMGLDSDGLNWQEMISLAQRRLVSPGAAMVLLSRDDCPVEFTGPVLGQHASHGDLVDKASMAGIQAAVAGAGFVPGARDRLLNLLIMRPEPMLQILGGFPVQSVLAAVASNESRSAMLTSRLAAELGEAGGGDPDFWALLHKASVSGTMTLDEVVGATAPGRESGDIGADGSNTKE